MTLPLLSARELRVSFAAGRWPHRSRFDALAGIDVAVRGGRVLGVVGESGSGKTTLLRVLAGLTAPSAGSVELDGTAVWSLPPTARRALLATNVGMVWQDPTSSMNPRLPSSAIVEDPLRIHRRGDAAARSARVAELLDLVRIPGHVRHRRIHELSGGQRQRVAVARALALQPRFLLADEPTSALDVSLRGELLDLLAQVRDELGVAVVLVSHDILATRYLADDIVVMYLGHIVERGAVHEVVGRPEHPYSQRLLTSVSTLSGHRAGGHA